MTISPTSRSSISLGLQLFNDDDWDGPPDEIGDGGDAVNGPYTPADGPDGPTPEPEPEPGPEGESEKTRVTLSDGRARELVSISSTHFFIEGKPVGVKEFMEHLLTKGEASRDPGLGRRAQSYLEQSADTF